jgi:hypothetical protein
MYWMVRSFRRKLFIVCSYSKEEVERGIWFRSSRFSELKLKFSKEHVVGRSTYTNWIAWHKRRISWARYLRNVWYGDYLTKYNWNVEWMDFVENEYESSRNCISEISWSSSIKSTHSHFCVIVCRVQTLFPPITESTMSCVIWDFTYPRIKMCHGTQRAFTVEYSAVLYEAPPPPPFCMS